MMNISLHVFDMHLSPLKLKRNPEAIRAYCIQSNVSQSQQPFILYEPLVSIQGSDYAMNEDKEINRQVIDKKGLSRLWVNLSMKEPKKSQTGIFMQNVYL